MSDRPRRDATIALLAGAAAVVVATIVGSAPGVLDAVVAPPTIVRAGLVGLSVVVGLWLLARAVRRLEQAGTSDVPGLIRGVRLVFLGVAAFAAGAGWALASPLPLIVAAVIAGIDVVETSFLLLVVAARGGRG